MHSSAPVGLGLGRTLPTADDGLRYLDATFVDWFDRSGWLITGWKEHSAASICSSSARFCSAAWTAAARACGWYSRSMTDFFSSAAAGGGAEAFGFCCENHPFFSAAAFSAAAAFAAVALPPRGHLRREGTIGHRLVLQLLPPLLLAVGDLRRPLLRPRKELLRLVCLYDRSVAVRIRVGTRVEGALLGLSQQELLLEAHRAELRGLGRPVQVGRGAAAPALRLGRRLGWRLGRAAGRCGVGRCGGWRARLGRLQADARRGRPERAALLVHQLLRAREIRIPGAFPAVTFKRQ